jgi:Lon protease-like protein
MDPIPDQLGVFPLPHIVLFPNALLPLHIFEPRYRVLLRDALKGSRRFVMAVSMPDGDGFHRVACLGKVVEHQPLPDGRSDLILKGERVVEIGEVVSHVPYRTARVRCFPEDAAFAEGPGARDRILELKRLLEDACPGCVEGLRAHISDDLGEEGGLTLLHTVAMHLPVDISRKLDWLQCSDSLRRWEKIRATLVDLGKNRETRKRVLLQYADLEPENPGIN